MPDTVPTPPPPRLRNARACEACRASKSRCIYKQAQEVCQRCSQNGSQCIVREKARPMRSRAMRSSLAAPTPAKTNYILDLPAVPTKNIAKDIEELQNHHRAAFDDDDASDSDLENPPIAKRTQPVIKSRKITLEEAEDLLSTFRVLAPSYPFVKVPRAATVPSMSRHSPFLLLSMLTVGSRNDPDLYHQMDHEFRRVLGKRLVMDGNKSLDFLEGLLVYIAWAPLPMTGRNHQSFVFLNLAISLTFDLGLDKELPNPLRFVPIDTTGLVENGEFTSAAKRAYLGSYYLATVLSLGLHRPNSFQYCELVDLRGREASRADPSCGIYYMCQLVRLWERISGSYSTTTRETSSKDGLRATEAKLQGFLDELQDVKSRTDDSIRSIASIGILERLLSVNSYGYHLGVAFLRGTYQRLPKFECQPEHITQDFHCLEVCKAFFEYVLSLPDDIFLRFTTVQWGFVAQSFVVLSRLTFAMAADMGWDADVTRTNIPMMMYLECLCWKLQGLSRTAESIDDIPQTPDQVAVVRKILETLKRSYSKRVADIRPAPILLDTAPRQPSRGFCPMKDPDLNAYFNLSSSGSSESISQNSNSTGSSVPVYFDIWSTMTGSWAMQEK